MRLNVGYLFAAGAIERMCIIGKTGNVGIGTTNPGYRLSVQTPGYTTTPGTNIINNGAIGSTTANIAYSDYITYYQTNPYTEITSYNSVGGYQYLPLRLSGNPVTITTGNVGIGTTTTQCQLHLYSATTGGQIGIAQQTDNTTYMRLGMDTAWLQYICNNAYWNGSAYNYVTTGGYGGLASRISQISGSISFDTQSSAAGVNPISWLSRLYVGNSGNIGIGTSSPSNIYKLHISSGDSSHTLYGPNTTWGYYLACGSGGSQITATTCQVTCTNGNLHLDAAASGAAGRAIYLNFYTSANGTAGGNGSAILSYGPWTHTGNFNVTSGIQGVGTTSPVGTLTVQVSGSTNAMNVGAWGTEHFVVTQSSGVNSNAVAIGYQNGVGGWLYSLSPSVAWRPMNYGAASHNFYNQSASPIIVMSGTTLSCTGDIIAYSSDDRLKKRLRYIDSPLDKLKSLSGFIYVHNEVAKSHGFDDEDEKVGVSAQEVQKVVPQAVKPAPFDLDDEKKSKSGQNYLTVQYERLVPLLIEALKEESRKREALEELVRSLDTRIKFLEQR
jgi:hypothetical protein